MFVVTVWSRACLPMQYVKYTDQNHLFNGSKIGPEKQHRHINGGAERVSAMHAAFLLGHLFQVLSLCEYICARASCIEVDCNIT